MSARSASTCARRSPLSCRSRPQPRNTSTPGLMYPSAERGIDALVQIAAEDVGPELHLVGLGRLLSSSPQPGQKSSLVMNSFGRFAGFFFFVPGSALARDDVVLFVDLLLREHHVEEQLLELVGELLRLRRGAAALDHLLPRLQVGIEARRLREERDPAIEQLVIELLLIDDLARPVLLRLAGHLPRGLQVLRRLQRQRLRELPALGLEELAEQLLLLLDLLLERLVFVDDRLRRQRILVVRRCSGRRRPASSSPSSGSDRTCDRGSARSRRSGRGSRARRRRRDRAARRRA